MYEDVEVGSLICRVEAVDPDVGAHIRFSLDYEASQARQDNGRILNTILWKVRYIHVLYVQEVFSLFIERLTII